MPNIKPKTLFEAAEMKIGTGWYVLVTHPKGQQSHLGGFKTESEANGWIESKSAEWLKEFGANHA
ncbi:hypothetical protein SAMN05519103_04770 [Rhizobiales bacterium GAS113]|jgi:hypothetical protein|nr:hypothetical protein SAMN05519103_04770 [Rhizobiales bacterium GAS113]